MCVMCVVCVVCAELKTLVAVADITRSIYNSMPNSDTVINGTT